ncbi:MAG: ABC transporter substrate-binding protein [Croceibacterium sp.]
MRLTGAAWAIAWAALSVAGATWAQQPPLRVSGNTQTIEIAPVLLAAADGSATVTMGGIPNLVGEPGAAGFSEPGAADLATNAETQLLRQSVKHPELRIILGVSEGLYRIVARRSAGIDTVADLNGKRVATIAATSSGYFLDRMLRRAGLTFGDIEARQITPLAGMTEALKKREVDAVVIWEPESLHAEQALGADAIKFDGAGVYRELFNLNTTAAKLADPASRARIVSFVRGVIAAGSRIAADPARAQALVAQTGEFAPRDVADSWRHHRFMPGFPADLLTVMVTEEKWLAERDKRPVRSRAALARLIDTSVYREALKGMPRR